MDARQLQARYKQLQQYVGWSESDAERLRVASPLLKPHFAGIIDDFYAEIGRRADARNVISDGAVSKMVRFLGHAEG